METQPYVVEPAHKAAAHLVLVLAGDVAREDHDVVEAVGARVVEHGADGRGDHGRVGVIRSKDHGHELLAHCLAQGRLEHVDVPVGLFEVDALHLLGTPVCPQAQLVVEVDVEQALGEVTRGAHGLHAVG